MKKGREKWRGEGGERETERQRKRRVDSCYMVKKGKMRVKAPKSDLVGFCTL